ncbi:MAG: hypothetical protein MZV63_42925 [Marinilabiliales bacterium]|nr:hypothetical protein [Marinilabiliales bacterium]
MPGLLAALAVGQGWVDGLRGAGQDVQSALLDAGGYLPPYLDVPRDHEWFKLASADRVNGDHEGSWVELRVVEPDIVQVQNDITLASELAGARRMIYPSVTEYNFSKTGTGPFSRRLTSFALVALQNSIELQRGRPAGITAIIFREV